MRKNTKLSLYIPFENVNTIMVRGSTLHVFFYGDNCNGFKLMLHDKNNWTSLLS